MGTLESPNFDFGVVNSDTMKLIFSTIVLQIFMPQGFLGIEKERKLQYQWYHNFRSYVVGVSLKDLTKPRKINGLQAASKVLLFRDRL